MPFCPLLRVFLEPASSLQLTVIELKGALPPTAQLVPLPPPAFEALFLAAKRISMPSPSALAAYRFLLRLTARKSSTPSYQLLAFPATGTRVDKAGCGRLVRLENVFVSLITANAYFSTIGGGAYLTRMTADAMLQAIKQIRVAELLGDVPMKARCWVNIAYCEIQLGRFRTAMQRLKLLERLSGRSEDLCDDRILLNMLTAAKRQCAAAWKLVKSGKLRGGEQGRCNGEELMCKDALVTASRHQKAARASAGPGRGAATLVRDVSVDEWQRFRLAQPTGALLEENKALLEEGLLAKKTTRGQL